MTGKAPIEEKARNNKMGYSLIVRQQKPNHGLRLRPRVKKSPLKNSH
jgi:hypothetical protein